MQKNNHRKFGKEKRRPRREQGGHSNQNNKTAQGIISVNSRGVGFVEVPGFKEDIAIDTNYLKGAFHGDVVEITISSKNKTGGRIWGAVTKVVSRAKTEFVGAVEKVGEDYVLITDDKKVWREIYIKSDKIKNAGADEKVLVKITDWGDEKKNPTAEVIKIIGKKGDNNVEMESIILEKGFQANFPNDIEKEAEIVAEREIPRLAEEIKNRADFRDRTTFTIDPKDAKDFDDAISFKKLDGGTFEIGVHIADVSHYVREGSLLDREARKRGFSVYLVDRTIPMLPEVLSNELCSLNPNEEKLAFSALFKIDKNGNVLDRLFTKSVIKSDKRFSYEEAQEVLNSKTGQHFEELNTMNSIAKIFQAEKFKNGAIDFETEEVKFTLDENGVPLGVYKKERLETHKLVEEYMLLANREVAEFLSKKLSKSKQSASIYRIHNEPDKDRLANLTVFLKAMGYNLPTKDGTVSSKDINNLLREIEGRPEASLIKTATLRSMAKAVYSVENIGHFGLGFEHYTHFTSPIRRYADLMVHRILERHLTGGKIGADEFARYKKLALENSEKEIDAAEAERASIKYKQAEYMSKHIGETYNGIISGVTEWGIYVEEENTKCEGMIKLRDLTDDYYVLDQKNYAIVGSKTGKKYSLGGKVRIKVAGTDVDRKTIDYVLA